MGGSRFVRVAEAAMEVRQDAEQLAVVKNALAYFVPPARAKR